MCVSECVRVCERELLFCNPCRLLEWPWLLDKVRGLAFMWCECFEKCRTYTFCWLLCLGLGLQAATAQCFVVYCCSSMSKWLEVALGVVVH